MLKGKQFDLHEGHSQSFNESKKFYECFRIGNCEHFLWIKHLQIKQGLLLILFLTNLLHTLHVLLKFISLTNFLNLFENLVGSNKSVNFSLSTFLKGSSSKQKLQHQVDDSAFKISQKDFLDKPEQGK